MALSIVELITRDIENTKDVKYKLMFQSIN